MSTISSPGDDRRGTLIALEPRLKVPFHPLYHEICRRKDLSPGAKVVYAVLCSYLNQFDDTFPGRERLAGDTGMSAHQLVDATKALVATGLLNVKRRGLGQTNVYTLLKWPESPEIPGRISAVPHGTSAESDRNVLPLEEREEEQVAGHPDSEQTADAIWSTALDQLRGRGILTSNINRLQELRVTIEGATLVINGPTDLAKQWTDYLRVMLGRPVRFVSG